MTKIPFKVSARTARLIGRENIASSKGAIIELVKNGYDADSKLSLVFFDNIFAELPKSISVEHYNNLVLRGVTQTDLEIYEFKDDEYKLMDGVDDDTLAALRKIIAAKSSLYIIDAGEGMNQQTIRDHWMTIGTSNKLFDMFTTTGRVKAGAKGIGRFALDKLGSKCEMITIFDPAVHGEDKNEKKRKTAFTGYHWKVNWEDFERENATIDNISAELTGLKTDSLETELKKIVSGIDLKIFEGKFKYGTMLKITGLRDIWEDYYVEQVFSDLEVLVPPKETGEFSIHLYSSLTPKKYGEVLGSVCDDYDFKLTAIANEQQEVEITVYRNEYDTELIDPELFKREKMLEYPYTREVFQSGSWKTKKTFSQLLPGYKEVDESKVLEQIGKFDFSFYFMKRTYTNQDAQRFHYRSFMAHSRKDWLDKFGGIKLFRDNFRVRPYGEVDDAAFDWLGLGNRKATSPAGVAKEGGGYRVEPENIAGAINISRITNLSFDDKSSREGVQENQVFTIFKRLIAAIIGVFEVDRSHIASEMARFYTEKNRERINREQAEELARKILEDKKKQIEKGEELTTNPELTILAELNEQKDIELERLRDEQKVLRGLASSGIVLASFSHDLSKLSQVLDSRIDKLKNLVSEKIFEKDYENIEDRKNPFAHMENMRRQDVKLQNWLKFSLGTAKKDKRKRNQLHFNKYFESFKNDWSTVLLSRGIELDISNISPAYMRIFEIDIDSIFNNLLVNSIDAFNISKLPRARKVTINVYNSEKEIFLDYYDSGPGLSPDIDVPEKIFEPLYTTKRNPKTGEEEGTGLGMWILKLIVADNDGDAKLLFPEDGGFGLRMTFPVKFNKTQNV